MIRVVLADDHALVREGVRALLASESDIDVVAEADNGSQAIEAVQSTKPDVLVLDLRMPGLGGLEALPQIRRVSPETQIVVLTMYDNEAYLYQALKSGAAGYVLKGCNSSELIRAVQQVSLGHRYVSGAFSSINTDNFESTTPLGSSRLTKREMQIMRKVVEGKTSAVIADDLQISRRTVETHRANMMRKLGVRNQADLIRYALTLKL